MRMTVRAYKVNQTSLGITIPKYLVTLLNLEPGDTIEVEFKKLYGQQTVQKDGGEQK